MRAIMAWPPFSGSQLDFDEFGSTLDRERNEFIRLATNTALWMLVESARDGRERRYHLAPTRLADARSALAERAAAWDARLGRLKAMAEGATHAATTESQGHVPH